MNIRLIFTISVFTCFTLAYSQNKFDCKCDSNTQKVFLMTDKNDKKLLVCGILQDSLTDITKTIIAISIYDCSNNKLVLSCGDNNIAPFTVTKHSDSIVFYTHHFAPIGDDWKMSSIPYQEWSVYFKNDSVEISMGRTVFSYPNLTKKQIDSIKTICKTLESYKKNGKINYPLDYETLYILFIGALKDISNARTIYENLLQNFEFDGAAAETLGEIQYKTLIKLFKN